MENGILHVDMNNFYASVETLFAPQYKDVPMAVAGDKESRHGIILAKNMLAKSMGVQTADCPANPPGGEGGAGLTVSIGVSYNKVFAKLGSDYKKPDAVTVFGREQMESVIWKLPAQALLFVGPHTEKTLEKFGIHTIGDIARMELPAMRRMLGKTGEALWTYANGLDHSPVAAAGAGEPPKTIGNSTTLPHDVTSEEEVRRVLLELAESVASRLRRQGRKAGEVQLTVKNGDFQEYQRQCQLEPAVCDARSLYKAALALYRREDRRWAVRLLGLRAGKLVEAGAAQMSFFANTRDLEREERLETAVDALRERFGGGSVRRGTVLEKKEREGE